MKKNFGFFTQMIKKSFSYKVIRAFLIALVLINLLYFVTFKAVYHILTDELSRALYIKMSYLTETLEEEVERIQKLLYECVNDDTLYYTVGAYPILSIGERTKGLLDMQDRLELLHGSSVYIENVTMYVPGAKWKISSTDGFRSNREEGEKVLRQQEKNSFSPCFYADNRIYMGSSYPYGIINKNFNANYILLVELKEEAFRKALDILEEYPDSGVRLTDRGGEYELKMGKTVMPVKSSKGDWWYQEVKNYEDGQNYVMFNIYSDFLDMDLLVGIPSKIVYGNLYLYRNFFFIIVAIVIMMMAIYLYSVHTLIDQPIRTLMQKIEQMEQGNLETRIEEKREDEFGYLYIAFNRMAESLHRQMEINYEQKLLTQQAQLRQLQSQINPHFLYNSFFSIYRMAKNEDCETIVEFSSYLAEYYRYITKDAQSDTTLRMETEHAGRYARIQEMRFKRRLCVELEELPERFGAMRVPRLILQPLLENAFEHGLNNVEEGGLLKLWYEIKDGKLYIHTQDNGSGMSDEELEKLRESFNQSGSRIENGMCNINRRLKMRFGEQYGIEINAREGKGTVCSLVLPEGEERDSHVQSAGD